MMSDGTDDPSSPPNRRDLHHDLSNSSSTSNRMPQILDGKTFCLDPTRMKVQQPNIAIRAAKVVAAVVLSPLILVGSSIYVAIMLTGPKSFQDKLMSMIIPRVMARVAEDLKPERNELLGDTIEAGDTVLDVGSGGGGYMPYLKRVSKVVALEPVEMMHPVIRESAKKAGVANLELYPFEIEDYMQKRPKGELFDCILLGNVLCEVKCLESTLETVDRLLKPGGYIYFSEHVGQPRGTFVRQFQDFVNPFWRAIFGGCNCNRDSLSHIEDMKGWDSISWTLESYMKVMGPFIMGLAKKKREKEKVI
mmetsp:Transcript_4172/g.7478  ORF Transcript_4172/g.7478 Transcript_4172/m.7478 type:complete len:306 (-) Transcript_4172:165-1082(-)